MTILPYQVEGAQFLADKPRRYLADDMGLGKSYQAIRAADTVGATTGLVLCPATLKANWKAEFEKWAIFPRSIAVWDAKQAEMPEADVVIANYEMLLNDAKFNQMSSREVDFIICDEAHRLKSTKAARTNRALGPHFNGEAGVCGMGKHVWWLSGTPAPNDASELYTAARFFYGEPKNFWTFQQRYCVMIKTSFGNKIVGQRNISELRDKLKPYILRRRADQVLKDLPPISFHSIALTPDNGASIASDAKLWERLLDISEGQYRQDLKAMKKEDRDKGLRPGKFVTADFAKLSEDEVLRHLQRANVDGSRLKHAIGVTKAPTIVALVNEEFDAGLDKIIIFAWHAAVIDILAEGLAKHGVVIIDGRTPIADRHAIVQQFQTNPNTRVFIGNITAAGEGLTLTAANHVLFAEQSWVPKDNMQAAKRAHRIGQSKPVFARFASFPGTIDDVITKAVARKTAMLTELIEDPDVNQT